jgi:hypothetical protein
MHLREFRVLIGALSENDPGCREISFDAIFEDHAGGTTSRNINSLVYDGMLSDSDQIPWLIASTLRTLMGR